MKKILFLFLLIVAGPLLSQQITNLKVINHKFFSKLPSASGVELYKNKIYLIADDLPWLFELNQKWNAVNKYPVSGITKIKDGRTPKKIKADFESMALIRQNKKDYMLILSSGSKMIKRDTAFLFSMKNKQVIAKKNIRPWYEAIKKEAGIEAEDEINIEGVATTDDKIYVLHRGNISGNFVAVSSINDFINYLTGKTGITPNVTVFKFKLPVENGVAAGFSGACLLPGSEGLLVTASLEATGNVIDDGAVLGSYLGYIPLSEMEKGTVKLTPITNSEGKVLAKKQEGIIVVKKESQGNYRAFSVCDNDDGSSDIFELEFTVE